MKQSSPPQPDKNKDQKKLKYHYFWDTEGRLKRFRKMEYKPRPGYIRLPFIEKYYFWWKRKSFDFKNAILPWFLGFGAVFIIYKFSMVWSQNDLQRQIKAKMPFQFTADVVKEMKALEKENHSKIR